MWFFTPKIKYTDVLEKGEIGFITAGIKHVSDCKVGDTITDSLKPTNQPLSGFKPSRPVVFCGLYPIDADDYDLLRDSLLKLGLNDASFHLNQRHLLRLVLVSDADFWVCCT